MPTIVTRLKAIVRKSEYQHVQGGLQVIILIAYSQRDLGPTLWGIRLNFYLSHSRNSFIIKVDFHSGGRSQGELWMHACVATVHATIFERYTAIAKQHG